MAGISEELRRQMVAEAAYFRAERRRSGDGDEVEDWLEAEREIDAGLAAGHTGSLEERLAATNERLKAFRKRLAEKSGKARREWEDDLAKLANYRDKLRKRLRQTREDSGHAADKARVKAEETWDEISSLLERLGGLKSGETAMSGAGKRARDGKGKA